MAVALLSIDVIKDFFDPQGKNYHPIYSKLLINIKDILTCAHKYNDLVIHAIEAHRPGPDFEYNKLPPHCLLNSWETEFPADLEIADSDIIVYKRRYSAFFATDLDLLLRERNIQELVIIGVKSHVCVRATIQDAFAYGYKVFLVREATGSNWEHLHKASLEDVQRYMGEVISLDEAKLILLKGTT